MKYSKKNNSIQVSKKDMELFIREIHNPKKPNDNLKKAALRFNELISKL